MAVEDTLIPRVNDEVKVIAGLFPDARVATGADATVENLLQQSGEVDVLHLACHARFRSDNPLFSALQLKNGWFTVRDAYKLNLSGSLVTLSACETGVNAVAPGEELIGLARGFLSAGIPTVLLSLWTVDDEATTELMTAFYRNLMETQSPAKALRSAQINMLNERPHPFFWSPFALVGRW